MLAHSSQVPRRRDRRNRSSAVVCIESLEPRHALTAADLLPSLADMRAAPAIDVVDDRPLLFDNHQVAMARGTNVGSEVSIQRVKPHWTMDYRIRARADAGSDMDPIVALYDENGQQLAFNDDVSRTDNSGCIQFLLTTGTTYFVAVTSYDRGTTGAYTIDVVANLIDDVREPDDTLQKATNVANINGSHYDGVLADAHDYFRITLPGTGTTGSESHIDFNSADGDIDLSLLDAKGREISTSDGTTDRETISFANLPRGTYYLDVHGYSGAYSPSYTLTSNVMTGPSRAAAIAADRFEGRLGNNTLARVTNLGQVQATSEVKNLTITAKDVDFFKFTLAQPGRPGDELLVGFQNALGDLDAELLNTSGGLLDVSNGWGDGERISLAGLSAGTYVLKVYGYRNAANPSYGLRFNYGVSLDTPLQLPYSGPDVHPNPVVPPSGQKGDWTVAVYMTSTDLADFAFADINEMEKAVSRFATGARITVFWDQWNQKPFATGGGSQAAWGTAGRAVIQPDTNVSRIATPFDIIGERNSGDPAVLRDFLTWTMTVAPANHYAMVMWDHGGGLSGSNFDDESGYDSLTAKEIQNAVGQSGMHPDLLSYDACLMGTTEQFYELRNVAPVQVAAEEIISGPGYDYTSAFSTFNVSPANATAKSVAQGMVTSFAAQYGTDGKSTFAAVESVKMNAVAGAMKAFVDASAGLTASQFTRVRSTIGKVTRFEFPQYVDLLQLMSSLSVDSQISVAGRTAAAGVVTAVKQAVFAKMADERGTGGMSIYLPSSTAYETDLSGFGDWIAATNSQALVNRVLGRSASARPSISTNLSFAPRGR